MTIDTVQLFKQQGYCLAPKRLSDELLNRWRLLTQDVESDCLQSRADGIIDSNASIVKESTGYQLIRFNDIYKSDPELTLATLASPALLEVIKTFCGKGAVPLQMDIIYKQQHPHPITKWHQDAMHNRAFPYINIGVYLDDANENDGCLRYLPGSQHQAQDVQALSEKYGWDIPGAAERSAKAGDILVHDMMVLHGSMPKRSPGVRRTLYIEVRPWQAIIESGTQSKHWSDLRRQWMATVLEQDIQHIWPDAWKDEYILPLKKDNLFNSIAQNREPPIPSVWETFPVDKPGYPVPMDMEE